MSLTGVLHRKYLEVTFNLMFHCRRDHQVRFLCLKMSENFDISLNFGIVNEI